MVYTREKYLAYHRDYYYKHKEERKHFIIESAKKYNRKIKLRVAEHYGNKCVCCNESNINLLTIHHIHGREDKNKEENKRTGIHFWKWLDKNNYPKGYQLICYNCNLSTKNYKKEFCPVHHTELYKSFIRENLTEHYMRFHLLNFQKRRQVCIEYYGSKCRCCGETKYEFLTIDHINHSESAGKGLYGERLYRYLIKNNFPDGFQVLCWNCNCVKSDVDKEFCYIHHPEIYESKPTKLI